MEIIARIYTDFKEKFGIPRQSGLADTKARIVFEPKYRNPDSLRGLEGFSHIWLLWEFTEAKSESWRPTVRPPRLGGNKKMGVFATRSPFRPNPIGLSSVKLEAIKDEGDDGTVLYVLGADILDGTPIYDIKPYLPFTDSHPDAKGGFADEKFGKKLNTHIGVNEKKLLSEFELCELVKILEEDPRPQYQSDPERIYGMKFGKHEIKFKVLEEDLYVTEIT